MKKIHLIMGAILLLFMAAAIAGILATRPPGPDAEPSAKPVVKGSSPAKERLVDTRLLLTARRLAVLATALDEQEFSRQALRLADHELDLALADSIRRTVENHAAPSPEIKAILALSDKGQDAVKGDQQRIKMIETQLAGAREQDQEILEDQLEVAKAQLELDKNELDEAQDDLDRAGGDVQAKIRRLKAAHEAAQGNSSLVSTLRDPISQFSPDSLVARISMWSWQLSKLAQLRQAHQEAQTKIERMSKRRDSLAQKIKLEKEDRETVKRKAASFARGDMKGVGESSKEISKATLQTLKRFMSDQRTLADMGKRLQFVKDLAEVYGGWTVVVESHRRAALHQMLRSLMVILSILGVMFFGKLLVGHMFAGAAKTRGIRAATLRNVAIFVLQIQGILVILFVVFGVPTQMTTILGLAGAGLTVAMKDFIVAFFGWFVLMGKNGIRVGDWVEIDGVAGEVVEIGLLHTVLLETGSLNDSAHPTGRRVAFVNSFAIEGHFFNFSTSGQWMWDELKVAVPSGQDLYPFIDAIRKQVEEMTQINAKLAEQEWRGSTKRYRIQSFSAVPRISVVPIANGIELHVGYITRAYESHETRIRLNQSLVDLMHGKRPDEVR
ncbi:MAG: mechanosensitive ion channel domain-containing protein [Syntrophus sp. (in: bacteria)]